MSRPSLREKMLASGVGTIHELGYGNAGIREITAAAGVPQGSFTNHFPSKEAFASAALDRYYERVQANIAATLGNSSVAPSARIRAYFDQVTTALSGASWRRGCLIGNMSLETAEHSEVLRERLVEMFAGLTNAFAQTLREAQAAGEARTDIDAGDMAAVLMASWQGAMLRMKVERTSDPIDRFKNVLLAALLTVPPTVKPRPAAAKRRARRS